MKILGRVVLFIVVCGLVALAIPTLLDNVKLLNEIGWKDLFGDPATKSVFISFLTQCLNCLFALVALIAVIRGKGSFLLFIFAAIMIGGVIWHFVSAGQAGTLGDAWQITQTVFGFALPIGYFLGSLFIIL